MIREKELTDGEINAAVSEHHDEAGLQASLGLMERRSFDANHYRYWEITHHVRAISQMRHPSLLKFSPEDAANSVRRLRSLRTPRAINAAVTWYLQGKQFGIDAIEADQNQRLVAFLGDLSDLADKVVKPFTIKEAYELFAKPDFKDSSVYTQLQKDII